MISIYDDEWTNFSKLFYYCTSTIFVCSYISASQTYSSQLARRTFIIFLFVMLSFRIPLSFKSRCKNLLVLANSLEDRFQTKCRGVLYHVEYSFFFCIPVSFIFVTGVTIIFIAGSMNNFSNPQR